MPACVLIFTCDVSTPSASRDLDNGFIRSRLIRAPAGALWTPPGGLTRTTLAAAGGRKVTKDRRRDEDAGATTDDVLFAQSPLTHIDKARSYVPVSSGGSSSGTIRCSPSSFSDTVWTLRACTGGAEFPHEILNFYCVVFGHPVVSMSGPRAPLCVNFVVQHRFKTPYILQKTYKAPVAATFGIRRRFRTPCGCAKKSRASPLPVPF